MPTPTAMRPRRSFGLHRYATVLRAPHARQLALGGLLAYVGEAGTMFAVLLAARAATGSFATAGTAFGATVLGAAAGRIPQGRLIDRVGLRPVLLPLAALQLALLVAIASALSAHADGAVLVALAALVGVTLPAMTAVTRTTVLSRPLALLTLLALAFGLAVGVPEVVVPAFATDHGALDAIGALIAAWGAGSVLGGLWYGTRSWRGDAERRLVAFLAAIVVTLVPLVLAGTPLVLGALLLLAGLPLAPAVTTLNLLVDAHAPRERAAEAFAWVGSALVAGIACGTTLAGWVVSSAGVEAGFVASVALSVLPLGVALAILHAARR